MPIKPILVIFLLLFGTMSNAQDTVKFLNRSGDTIARSAKFIIEAAYPGGDSAWNQYLIHHLQYPMKAIERRVAGDVIVQFQIDDQGNTGDYKVVSGPTKGGLREEAIRVIRESGKWEPSIMNGKKVASFKTETIHFRISVI